MRFEGTKEYVATDDLKVSVNAAITLQKPLLVKGEPGTGKTVLARGISNLQPKPNMDYMNMMPLLVCVMVNLETIGSVT